jgi:hypothetical protein
MSKVRNLKRISTDPDYGSPTFDSTGGLISQTLAPAYSLLHKYTKSWVKYTPVIWPMLSILVILILLRYEKLAVDSAIAIFSVALFLEIFSANEESVMNLFRGKSEQKIQYFLESLGTKELAEILEFIEQYHLKTHHIISILNSKYKNNLAIYSMIYKHQSLDVDLIDYLVEAGVLENLSEESLAKFILECETSLNKKTFDELMLKNSQTLRGAAILKEPTLVQNKYKSLWLRLQLLRISSWIDQSLNSRIGKLLFSAFSICVLLFAFGTSLRPAVLSITDLGTRLLIIIYGIGILFVLTLFLIVQILNLHRWIVLRVWPRAFKNVKK